MTTGRYDGNVGLAGRPVTGTPPVVLSIAGSDPSGGAGIQADLKTLAAQRVYGMAVITALTAQNTTGVRGVHPVSATLVARQLEAVLADLPPAAVKVGMVADEDIAAVIVASARLGALPNLVLDPVLRSSSGDRLGALDAIRRLMPHTMVLTPNRAEASALVGWPVETSRDMVAAARQLAGAGPVSVVVTGGDADGGRACDALCTPAGVWLLCAPRVTTTNTHGTGCAFSSAIAAWLALGEAMPDAVLRAKAYVTNALRGAQAWRLGAGTGPIDHNSDNPPDSSTVIDVSHFDQEESA